MYGPAASPPPQPPPGTVTTGPAGAGTRPGTTRTLLVRIAFASFPVWSLGLLAWVPSLRFAVLRRRPRDWMVFAGACVLTALYIVLLFVVPESKPGEEGNAQLGAGVYIVLLIGGAVVHAVLGDRAPRAPRQAARPAYTSAPAPGPYAPAARPAPRTAPPASPPPYGGAAPYAPTVSAHPAPAPDPSPAPSPGPAPAPAPVTSPRMRQVASELDELGQFLRQKQPGGRQQQQQPDRELEHDQQARQRQPGRWDRP
ncbi:hypothetical protein ACH4RA_23970 [Streptomyces smyrnaeus]|uniref:hypothetical protein n=1 Tax=Streptomyces smyrnaeus TaxID=1387713 RepID=UPI00161A99FF